MRYRSVLVENEQPSLLRLKRLLSSHADDIEVIGEAGDGPSAVEKIRDLTPDVVFLDIDLPGFNGFQVLEKLEQQPAVIFTTAFNQHALDAFKAYAVDYLLKPIDAQAMARAIDKLRAMGFNHDQFTRAMQHLLQSFGSEHLTRLACKEGNRTVLLKMGEILYVQSDNKYTSVHTGQREYLIDMSLVDLERRINPKDFIRIHRSILVNISWIAELRRNYDGKTTVILKDTNGTELVASRIYAENLRNL